MSRGTDLPATTHDPDELRGRVQDVLDGPAYADAEPGLLAEVGDRVLREVVGFLDSVLGAVGGSTTVAWALVAIGLVLVGVVVWRLTRGASLDRQLRAPAATAEGRSADDWRAEARAHDAAGRGPEAVLAWYRAAIAGLVSGGVLEDVPGRTVRELDVEVARHAPGVADRVAAAGAAVDRVWYGHQPAGPTELGAARRADEAVRGLERTRERAPGPVRV